MSKILSIFALVAAASLVYFAQGNAANGASFGFEKNAQHRKSADAESVKGCMLSCQDMLAGWLLMNPDSKNYDSQKEKIEAKSEQCLAMNELAGFPYSKEDILSSCGLSAQCVEVPLDISPSDGACGSTSFIKEANLPACCSIEGGIHETSCGADAEWVVGVAAYPVCYIPNS